MALDLPPGVTDDKAPYIVPFVADLLRYHQKLHANSETTPPLIIGLSAPQGAGKSVLVSLLHKTLTLPPHSLNTAVFSIDDFYLTHADQLQLARTHSDIPLLQHRGQPGTHDVPLLDAVFSALREGKKVSIPQYNKAAFSGQGDRLPENKWVEVNANPERPVQVVLFEGWCVGFRALTDSALEQLWEAARGAAEKSKETSYQGRLGYNTLESVSTINKFLSGYDAFTDKFDGLVHIDAADPLFVYKWRKEQEQGLIKSRGSGMTEEQVEKFVDGYFPAYELYVEGLRKGVLRERRSEDEERDIQKNTKRQLRLIVGEDRKVIDAQRL